MWKWIVRLVLVGAVGSVGYYVYDEYRAGYFDLPEFNSTSYAISFKNGLRAIVVDPEVAEPMEDSQPFFRRLSIANPDRRYLGFPMEVPQWFEDTWAFCHPPTEEERTGIEGIFPDEFKRSLVGARFEAVCKIEADGESIGRGLIYSVPKQ